MSNVVELYLPTDRPLRFLVVGNGGREHSVGLQLVREGAEVCFAAGNAGTSQIGENLKIQQTDIQGIINEVTARKNTPAQIDIVLPGPEASIAAGIVDRGQEADIPVIGPTKEAAKLESDKAWAIRLFQKYNIPHPESFISGDIRQLLAFARKLPALWKGGAVAKFPGLASGKGVIVPDTQKELEDAIYQIMDRQEFGQTHEMILQRRYSGPEVSFIALTDGVKVVPFVDAGDYKRAYDGDHGPNTGGMGAVSPSERISQKVMADGIKIIRMTVDALRAEGIAYRGPIYLGAMLTEEGLKVIEFNCRFGDPETQVLMKRLRGGLIKGLIATLKDGELSDSMLEFLEGYAVAVILASGGYPGKYEIGKVITGLENVADPLVDIIHAGTALNEKGDIITDGGRVLASTAFGKTRAEARRRAYRAAEQIMFEGREYRLDIAA